MDDEVRRVEREGDLLRVASWALREGRTSEGLDRLERACLGGEALAASLLYEALDARPVEERLSHVRRLERLAGAGVAGARERVTRWFPPLARIVGESETMRSLRTFLAEHARTTEPVVLLGEDGVGGSLAADVLHALSGRTLFEANLAATEPELLREELAHVAPGSTLVVLGGPGHGPDWFFELHEVALANRARLVVRSYGPVASSEPRTELTIAPLRERFADLDLLARSVLGPGVALDDPAREALAAYPWPGNVRELANVLTVGLTWAGGPERVVRLGLEHLPVHLRGLV